MAKDRLSGTLAVILRADIAGSTALVQEDKELAHERIQDTFNRFGKIIEIYNGHVLELPWVAENGIILDAISAG